MTLFHREALLFAALLTGCSGLSAGGGDVDPDGEAECGVWCEERARIRRLTGRDKPTSAQGDGGAVDEPALDASEPSVDASEPSVDASEPAPDAAPDATGPSPDAATATDAALDAADPWPDVDTLYQTCETSADCDAGQSCLRANSTTARECTIACMTVDECPRRNQLEVESVTCILVLPYPSYPVRICHFE